MATEQGWIKVHRKILRNKTVMKSPDHFMIWMYLLLNATHKAVKIGTGSDAINLKPGEILTGRKAISKATGIDEYKVFRVLKEFKSAQAIAQRNAQRSKASGQVITILAWDKYQQSAQGNAQASAHIQEYIYNKNDINKGINNISVCVKGQRPHTHPYGKLDNVYLTADEYQDLKTTYQNSRQLINKVSLWLPDHERNNHYAVCLKFAQADNWPKAKHEQDTALLEADAREMSEEEQAEADRVRAEVMQQIHRGRAGGMSVDKEEQLQ